MKTVGFDSFRNVDNAIPTYTCSDDKSLLVDDRSGEYTLADPVRRVVKAFRELEELWNSDSEVPLVINDTMEKVFSALNELEAE